MKVENLTEQFWRKIKFVLLVILAIIILFIIQTKFILKIPEENNNELLGAIDNYETILEIQKEYALKTKEIHEEIKVMKFDVHQVQLQDEINKKIYNIESVYKQNKMNSKYFFGIQSAKILQIYFDTKEEYSSLIKNKDVIVNNLKECKANI